MNDSYDELLKSREVTRRLGIAYSTLLKKVKNGEIPCVRLGKHLRFRREDIEQYIGAPLPSQQAAPKPEPAAVPAPVEPDPPAPAPEEPLLDPDTWLERYEAAGKPEPLPLDLFLTVPDEAFDAAEEMVPQFRTEGLLAASIVRNAPRSFLVSIFYDGEWHDEDGAGAATGARWIACDALWRAVHAWPRAVDEDFVEALRAASIAMYRVAVEADAQRWRDSREHSSG
jgi:excisionase family DNA binding protein